MKAYTLLGIAPLLAGCGGILSTPAEPPRLMTLTSWQSTGPHRHPYHIAVDRPQTTGALSTNRIALQNRPFEMSYFAGVAWDDEMPLMVQRHIVRSLEPMVAGVSASKTDFKPSHILHTRIDRWDVDYTSSPSIRAVIQMSGYWVDTHTRKVVHRFTACGSHPVPSDSFDHVATGFQQALNQALKSLIQGVRF